MLQPAEKFADGDAVAQVGVGKAPDFRFVFAGFETEAGVNEGADFYFVFFHHPADGVGGSLFVQSKGQLFGGGKLFFHLCQRKHPARGVERKRKAVGKQGDVGIGANQGHGTDDRSVGQGVGTQVGQPGDTVGAGDQTGFAAVLSQKFNHLPVFFRCLDAAIAEFVGKNAGRFQIIGLRFGNQFQFGQQPAEGIDFANTQAPRVIFHFGSAGEFFPQPVGQRFVSAAEHFGCFRVGLAGSLYFVTSVGKKVCFFFGDDQRAGGTGKTGQGENAVFCFKNVLSEKMIVAGYEHRVIVFFRQVLFDFV